MTPIERLVRVRSLVDDGTAHQIRQRAGLSLREISQQARVSQSSVWNWERGERKPHGAAALRYLDVLELLEKVTMR